MLVYSDDNWGGDGFTANGTLQITPGGGSRSEVLMKHGTFVPVPEPATWALLIAGFGMVGAAARRRRTAVAA